MLALQGTWKGEGIGEYPPNVPPFQYIEELRIAATSKPLTWEFHSITHNKSTGKPMHSEMGYIRCNPASNSWEHQRGKIEFCVTHPFGLTEVSQGNYLEMAIEVTSRNEGLTRSNSAKTPFVTEIRRFYELKKTSEGSACLEFLLEMATTVSPMQNHLVARLYKSN